MIDAHCIDVVTLIIFLCFFDVRPPRGQGHHDFERPSHLFFIFCSLKVNVDAVILGN
jgi:hypothetical protein